MKEDLNSNVVNCGDFDLSIFENYLGVQIVTTYVDDEGERRELSRHYGGVTLILTRDEVAELIAGLQKALAE